MEKPSPLISIITVCYNAESTIETTIRSVANQIYKPIEYIIIDGKSSDNTLSIIDKNRQHISKFISEKDKGLYDAMNKGLELASGDYVFFLNADDLLYDDDTLNKIFSHTTLYDVYYGEAMYIDERGKELGLRSELTPQKAPEGLTWRSLAKGMVVSHQAFIVRKEIAPLYNLKYKLCADVDWMIRCLKQAKTCYNAHVIFSKFRIGGVSKQHQKQSWKERYQILNNHFGAIPNFFNHIAIAFRYLFNKKY